MGNGTRQGIVAYDCIGPYHGFNFFPRQYLTRVLEEQLQHLHDLWLKLGHCAILFYFAGRTIDPELTYQEISISVSFRGLVHQLA